MSRTLGSIPVDKSFPPPGQYPCTVTGVHKKVSKNKQTPYLEITLAHGDKEFSDSLFITEKALSRICLVAKRVCGMEDNFELPDEDDAAVRVLTEYIFLNIIGKKTVVTIEENAEVFIPESGPDMGRKVTKMRRRVAFSGYDRVPDGLPF